jgi:hypothetical protein
MLELMLTEQREVNRIEPEQIVYVLIPILGLAGSAFLIRRLMKQARDQETEENLKDETNEETAEV